MLNIALLEASVSKDHKKKRSCDFVISTVKLGRALTHPYPIALGQGGMEKQGSPGVCVQKQQSTGNIQWAA